MTKDTVEKALLAVQRHVDQMIEAFAIAGPGFGPGVKHHDYGPFIQAVAARDLLLLELKQLK